MVNAPIPSVYEANLNSFMVNCTLLHPLAGGFRHNGPELCKKPFENLWAPFLMPANGPRQTDGPRHIAESGDFLPARL